MNLQIALLICNFLFIGSIIPLTAFAQVPSPSSLLQQVTSRYQDPIVASFVHTSTSEYWEGSQSVTGSIQLHQNQYRIETLTEIITGIDNEAWIYRPQENQVLITTIDAEGLAYSPGTLLRSYEEFFDARTSDYEILNGIPHFRLELYPTQTDFSISTLTLWIRESDRMITKMVTMNQSSTRTEITLSNILVGIALPPETFEFSPPEGVEVIDLRS
ncbi:MAG: outer-membrane lipoprotein carrier protein LolA [Bacteroidetes bacterium]|nr:outer-membrane lipoprotein carrier protein LolA [Bacteroidota bacterium]MCY4233453.1 outer-membrane lipoprotein carrier protein LolA [Bacteroidota bacterium]